MDDAWLDDAPGVNGFVSSPASSCHIRETRLLHDPGLPARRWLYFAIRLDAPESPTTEPHRQPIHPRLPLALWLMYPDW
jgi:hypothetical protein